MTTLDAVVESIVCMKFEEILECSKSNLLEEMRRKDLDAAKKEATRWKEEVKTKVDEQDIVMVQVYSTSTNFSMTLNIDWHNIFGVLGRFHYENLLYCSVCQQLLKQYLSDFQSLAKF